MKERRFPRITTEKAVLVNRLGDDEIDGLGRTSVIGAGGCSFISSEAQEQNALLKLLISIRREVVEVRAKVVYVNRIEGGRFEIGVEFFDIKESDQAKLEALFTSEIPER